MLQNKCIAQVDSLDQALIIKNILNNHHIPYKEQIKSGGGWIQFMTLLFVSGRGSYGMNNEHQKKYYFYVEEKYFETSKSLLAEYNFK